MPNLNYNINFYYLKESTSSSVFAKNFQFFKKKGRKGKKIFVLIKRNINNCLVILKSQEKISYDSKTTQKQKIIRSVLARERICI